MKSWQHILEHARQLLEHNPLRGTTMPARTCRPSLPLERATPSNTASLGSPITLPSEPTCAPHAGDHRASLASDHLRRGALTPRAERLKIPAQQVRVTIHQAVNRIRLLLLVLALLLCAVPTAQAIRCPTQDFEPFQLTEEMPSPDQIGWYVVWAVASDGRIGLFVGNNPIYEIDPFGLEKGSELLMRMNNGYGGLNSLFGKFWNAPDTAIGLVVGGLGIPFGAKPTFGNNALQ